MMIISLLILISKLSSMNCFYRRIIDGDQDISNMYSYVVRIEREKSNEMKTTRRFLCTCTAIADVWVLTAAHCTPVLDATLRLERLELEKEEKIKFKYKNVIRYGSKFPGDGDKFASILFYVQHPNYRQSSLRGKKNNDIAILKTSPMLMKKFAKVSAVDHETVVGHEVVAAGHGIMNLQGLGTLKSNKSLQLAKLLVKKCEKSDLKSLYPCLCVARRCDSSVSFCFGDSGGPLIHFSGIIGIVSQGAEQDCMVEKKRRSYLVGLITPVNPYLQWITMVINEREDLMLVSTVSDNTTTSTAILSVSTTTTPDQNSTYGFKKTNDHSAFVLESSIKFHPD